MIITRLSVTLLLYHERKESHYNPVIVTALLYHERKVSHYSPLIVILLLYHERKVALIVTQLITPSAYGTG